MCCDALFNAGDCRHVALESRTQQKTDRVESQFFLLPIFRGDSAKEIRKKRYEKILQHMEGA